MAQYGPLFRHLFGVWPEDLTYVQWLTFRQFADDWAKAQEGKG